MEERVFNSPIDIAQMFRTKDDVRDFFDYLIASCVRYAQENEVEFLPFIYDEERESFNVSYDFFVGCIAKSFDIGNKETEEEINLVFSLKATNAIKDYNKMIDLNKAKSFLIIGLLQDYWKIIYPNNNKITGGFKGSVQAKDTYFLVNVYETKNGEGIEYETIPFKKKNVLELGCNVDLVNKMIEKSQEKGLKQVAFNPANAKKYWAKSDSGKRLLYK